MRGGVEPSRLLASHSSGLLLLHRCRFLPVEVKMNACFEEEGVRSDRCDQCGATLFVSQVPYFPIDDGERFLCAECVVRRGGRFDTIEQTWNPPPLLNDRRR